MIEKETFRRVTKCLALALTVAVCSAGAATAQEVRWRFAHENPDTVPIGKAVRMLAALVDARSGGRFTIDVFPAGQLGKEAELVEQVQLGTIEMMFSPTAPLSNFEPKMQLIDLPFLFPSRDVAYEVLDGEIGSDLLAALDNRGLKGLVFWESGFKQMTSSTRPIRSAEDLEGLKVRTMQSPLLISQYENWGANPIPIAFAETYNALQQGIAEAQENPLTSINAMRFYEVQEYLTLTNHGYTAIVVLANKDKYEALPDDLKAVLDGALKDTQTWQRAENQRIDKELLRKMREHMEVFELTPEQRRGFVEASRSFHDLYKDKVGADVLASVYKIVDQAP